MSKVTILSKPNRIVIASKGVQGPPGPESTVPGPEGLDAYEVAVAEGFVGTRAEWLASLKGDTGDVTPEAIAARDAAVGAASAAAQSAADAAAAFPGLDARVTELEENPAFPDAPDDGGAYIRVNGQWVQLYAPLALSGDLPDGTADEPYSATLGAAGGRAPYTLGDVLLPPGLDATLADATVTVAGTPTEAWEGDAHIDLSDSLGTAIRRALDLRIEGAPLPEIDLFVIVGQSNAEGRGDSALSPAAPHGVEIDAGVLSSPLADPVGDALTGSMWPAFSNEWYARTGRMSAFVEAAHGGTALLPDQAGTNWSPSGTLRGNAVALANAAIAGVSGSDSYALGSVYFVWSQGESDAENGVSEADYESALEEIAAYFKAQVPQMATMGVIQTGRHREQPYYAGFAAVRKAQDDACSDSPILTMLYRGAHSFWASNPTRMRDALHYNQSGLNVAGRCAALGLAAGGATIPPAPTLVAATAYPDPAHNSKSSRTIPHTVASGAKNLVVIVVNARPDNVSVQPIPTVTFNGASVPLVAEAGAAGGAGNGYARMAVYMLGEDAYGGPLSGESGDIVVSVNGASTARMIDVCAIDCAGSPIADFIGVFNPVPANASNGAVVSSSNAPGLWLTVAVSTAAGTVPLTATMTGATKVMDHGHVNAGGTRTVQMAVGHSSEPISLNRSVAVNWGSLCETIGVMTLVLRGKVAGE